MFKNNDYIIRNDTRVMYPSEYKAIRAELKNNTHQIIFDCMLFTGMRVVEFWRFIEHPDWLKPTQKCIDLPKGSMLQVKAKQAERTVLLSNWGLQSIEAMQVYMKSNPINPISKQGWQQALRRAATKAVENGTLSSSRGIIPKMTRKTWISWLLQIKPTREGSIAISSGQDIAIMLRQYSQLEFPTTEIDLMQIYTAGWGE